MPDRRLALVTGASSGIGREIAKLAAAPMLRKQAEPGSGDPG